MPFLMRHGLYFMQKFLPKRVEKEVISMRIASDTLAVVDKQSSEAGISRNEFINQCIAFALANMESTQEAAPHDGPDDMLYISSRRP